ncbi:TIGR04290 family methyltransferase [Roseitranquillus sediminis]|uniref:TIGR04290 family methyltransferase n=1 Tax=Roseitranquillus sediminis TaxID=2809051 RepID=UPI001D0C4333|nr:TIGR04290 family methyltransferase [Roseitranquillus sediminis]MBM9593381.1 TIGR04290 family methyltransferase [Roseitranquillus sediminis]
MADPRLKEQIRELGPWFHNLDIGGVATAPDHFLGDYPAFKWEGFRHVLPDDLNGASVLDIGCNAGFYSLEMKRRGAGRVVALEPDPHYLRQARFVAERTGTEIEFRQMTVYDVGQLGERFDLVIFMGVLYHLRHPLLALDLIHDHVADDLMLFQTMQRGPDSVAPVAEDYDFDKVGHFDAPDYPKMHFVEHRYAGDPTNWWVPNAACTQAMLRSAGFDILETPEPEVHLCRRAGRSASDRLSVSTR